MVVYDVIIQLLAAGGRQRTCVSVLTRPSSYSDMRRLTSCTTEIVSGTCVKWLKLPNIINLPNKSVPWDLASRTVLCKHQMSARAEYGQARSDWSQGGLTVVDDVSNLGLGASIQWQRTRNSV